jgi:hypothetical protein
MFRKYNKPAFLIIGAQKAGTSSLFRYLSQHPDIRLPKRKELHFFDLQYSNGIDWYERLFPRKKIIKRQITGEASPFYLFHPLVPERVFNHYPNIRLIVLLRNPVDRAYSHFHMERNRNAEPEDSFMRAVELEFDRIALEKQQITHGIINSGDYTASKLPAGCSISPQNSFFSSEVKTFIPIQSINLNEFMIFFISRTYPQPIFPR